MTTLLYSHPTCLDHDTGRGHPESAERLRRLLERLKTPEFAGLEWRDAPKAERPLLALAHRLKYISDVFAAIPREGRLAIDLTDTMISPRSGEAALRATGAVCAAVDAVMAGEAQNAFCAVRPPGHHAEAARAMGFCLFNNVAIGALHARKEHGLSRIAVVDFDVHHGNGTELILAPDRKLFFGSVHQALIFPQTGVPTPDAAPNVVNCALPRRAGSEQFRAALSDEVIPALRRFQPEFLLLSAGFDAHIADPLGDLRCTNEDYVWATTSLLQVAREFAQGRVVSVLEGGYNPDAVASAGAAHIAQLLAA